MRMLPLLVVLPLLAGPAFAQSAASHPRSSTGARVATASAVTPTSLARGAKLPAAAATAAPAAPVIAKAPPRTHHLRPWERQFTRANTTHDGHLTLQQAKAGYVTIARHFSEIDLQHKGFVTIDDVRAWHARRRHHRHARAARRALLQAQPIMRHSMLEVPLANPCGGNSVALPAIPASDPPAPSKLVDSHTPS